ncbi:MAG: hypothetical protein ACK4MS_15575 [Paracoccaceae bacterium]
MVEQRIAHVPTKDEIFTNAVAPERDFREIAGVIEGRDEDCIDGIAVELAREQPIRIDVCRSDKDRRAIIERDVKSGTESPDPF